MQKREADQISKAREAEERRNALVAKRDTKQKNKIRKMLKVIKSADKSVIADAKDLDNTAVTLQGPDQPDNDDYGYVSHEANAFYSKLMEKYNTSNPEQKTTGGNERKKSKFSIKETLERTKNQLHEASHSKKTNRTDEKRYVETVSVKPAPNNINGEPQKKQKPKVGPKVAPLPFSELLKIAEKKQFEPIEITVPVVPKQEERLMSKKEKLEHEERVKYMKYMKKRRAEAEKGGNKSGDLKNIPKENSAATSKETNSCKKIESPKANAQHIEKPISTQKANHAALPTTSTKLNKLSIMDQPKIENSKKASHLKPSSSRPIEKNTKHNGALRPKETAIKRRIIDDDSDNDSMDSFIDDGDVEDVSSYIKEIFGYDKSR